MTIAVTNPEIHGHVLWSLGAARGLAERHNCQIDFWIAYRAWAVADLLAAQKFVRKVIPDLNYPAHFRDQGPRGIYVAESPEYGYEKVYHLAFAPIPLGRHMADSFCLHEAVPCRAHRLDLPEDCPRCKLPEGKFVALAGRAHGQEALIGHFRHMVRRSPLPVVEVGAPGQAIAADLGALDRTGYGFLEMAGIISKSRYFVGAISAPLAVADAFPHVTRIALIGGRSPDISMSTRGPRNFFLHEGEHERLIRLITPQVVSEEEWYAARNIGEWKLLQDRLNKAKG